MRTRMAPSYVNLNSRQTHLHMRAPATHLVALHRRLFHDLNPHRRRTTYIYYLPRQHSSRYQIHFIPLGNIYMFFLFDVKVSLSQFGKVETNLYTKPTDKYQYLLQSSCHPRTYETDQSIQPRSPITTHLLFRRKLHITRQWICLVKKGAFLQTSATAAQRSLCPLPQIQTKFQLSNVQPLALSCLARDINREIKLDVYGKRQK